MNSNFIIIKADAWAQADFALINAELCAFVLVSSRIKLSAALERVIRMRPNISLHEYESPLQFSLKIGIGLYLNYFLYRIVLCYSGNNSGQKNIFFLYIVHQSSQFCVPVKWSGLLLVVLHKHKFSLARIKCSFFFARASYACKLSAMQFPS